MHNVSEMWMWYAFELNQKHTVIYCTEVWTMLVHCGHDLYIIKSTGSINAIDFVHACCFRYQWEDEHWKAILSNVSVSLKTY